MSLSVRRVVTGHDAAGKAVVVSDGSAPGVHFLGGSVGFVELWATDAMPVPIDNGPDPTSRSLTLAPSSNGSVFRIVDHPPESAGGLASADEVGALFASIGSSASWTGGKDAAHPTMHRTETVDYGIVLSGRIHLVLDDTEVALGPGDVVIQRGTNHAWLNRSSEPCRMAFILLDGRFAG